MSAIADLWTPYPGTYKVVDEAEDLIPALAQISIKALAVEVRETVSLADQREQVRGELTAPSGHSSPVTVRDVANKVIHGAPDRVVVGNGDIRLYFVNSPNEAVTVQWTELWFSAPSFISIMHRLLYVKPHDSARRDDGVRALILELGPDRFLPTRIAGT